MNLVTYYYIHPHLFSNHFNWLTPIESPYNKSDTLHFLKYELKSY